MKKEHSMAPELVSNIQRFSLDDGPGIRTTVFMKGCNLRCAWCHNPESLNMSPILQFAAQNCASCGKCVAVCPNGAQRLEGDTHIFDRALCKACGKCASVCRKSALKLIGRMYEPDELFLELIKDRAYFKTGGGVTFSGGEPALKPDFIRETARLCREDGIHTALDTAGNVPFANYDRVLPHISLFLFDVKCFTSALHKRWTQVENGLILENLRKLDAAGAEYTIRVPVIPSFNDDLQEQERIARFIASLSRPGLVELLPYHTYGVGKYDALGIAYDYAQYASPHDEIMEEALHCYLQLGLNARIS
ncbi:MAG: glycyl-radical enzyme activating protein [Desulfovibrio sp.]|uniref:glycyl-radical enzyme activating protein n=1 Tax=Desulfovibrio sp. 7SRBS1 TaxID=3378064 RepID=UPI003B40E146